LVVALIAFIVGMISAAGSAEQDTAERFVDAWAAQDFPAMHDELSGSPSPGSGLRSSPRLPAGATRLDRHRDRSG
jgi:hypothetical protein